MVLEEVVDADWCLLFYVYLVIHGYGSCLAKAILLVVKGLDGDGVHISCVLSFIPSVQRTD